MTLSRYANQNAKTEIAASWERGAGKKSTPGGKWSQHVTETSDAMDFKAGVFTDNNAKAIARSVKRSSETSHRQIESLSLRGLDDQLL